MQLTERQKIAYHKSITDRAAEYAADPAKGRAAGYSPARVSPRRVPEIGRLSSVPVQSDYAAWLQAIAEHDLPAGTWYIERGLGDGPMGANLVIR